MLFRLASAFPLALFLLPNNVSASDVVDFAASLLGRPYVWGAEGPNAFDCSGLVQYVFAEFGVDLPRRAIDQSEVGEPSGRRLHRGDLLFFSSDDRRVLVTHVGIYEGGGVMVNASKRYGRVRRDDLNDDYWATRFMFAKRLMSSEQRGEDPRGERDSSDPVRRTERSTGARREVARTLGRLGDILLRRYPR
jgi:hypothetical protein